MSSSGVRFIRETKRVPGETDHALGPLVHGLDEPELERGREVVVRDLASVLNAPNLLCDVEDDGLALETSDGVSPRLERPRWRQAYLDEPRRQLGLDLRLLLEDKAGEKGNDLFRLIRGESVLQDELGEDELVGRVDLVRKGGRADEWTGQAKQARTRLQTSQATRPFRRTVELSSMKRSSLRTSTRCS